MDGGVAPPPKQVTPWRWLAITILLGFAGALSALVGFGKGTYAMGPMDVEVSVRAAFSGKTELAITPIAGVKAGHAEAPTHAGFLAFRATVVSVHGTRLIPDANRIIANPRSFDSFVKNDNDEAMKKFVLKVGLMSLAGGAGGGAIIGLIGLRPRRLIEGAIAGVLLVAVLGLIAYQTYDVNEFQNVTFKPGVSLSAPLNGR
jgi:hypothetical protein